MKLKFIFFLAYLLVYGCGFKVLNQQGSFNIESLKVTGEKKIAFILKNDLNIRPIENNLPINMIINVEKKINVKEKNDKNEITKYEINLVAKVEYNLLKESFKKYEFIIKNKNEYSVESQHSKTLRNEKSTTNLLVEDLSKKILAKINMELNDI